MSELERDINDLLLVTRQFFFQLDKERCEEAQREEVSKLLAAIQHLSGAVGEQISSFWRVNSEDLTIHLLQNVGSSPIVTSVLDARVPGMLSVRYTSYKEDSQEEEYTLHLSRDDASLWRNNVGDLLDATTLVEHCMAKMLFLAQVEIKSHIKFHEQRLRDRLKEIREASNS